MEHARDVRHWIAAYAAGAHNTARRIYSALWRTREQHKAKMWENKLMEAQRNNKTSE
jgi:hypothetical protein